MRRLAPRMSWEQAVAEGRQLLVETEKAELTISEVNWLWGDLALRIVGPEAGTKLTKEQRETLDQWAEEIPCPYESDRLRSFRLTALAYPPAKRAENISHKIHETIRGREDRFEIITKGSKAGGLTLTNLYRQLGIATTARARTSVPEEVEEQVADNLGEMAKKDPERLKKMLKRMMRKDKNVATVMAHASGEVEDETIDESNERQRGRTGPGGIRDNIDFMDAVRMLGSARYEVRDAGELIQKLSTVTPAQRKIITDEIERLIYSAQLLKSVVSSDDLSSELEAFLASSD